MLVMIKTDLVTMKNYALVNLGLLLLVAVFITIGTGTLIAGVAALAAMLPSMYIFSIVAYDEMNGWERFRLTLPISRKQVVVGRYASILVVIALSIVVSWIVGLVLFLIASLLPQFELTVSLVENFSLMAEAGHTILVATMIMLVATLVMPLFMRYGMTKAVRIVPLVFIVFIFIVIALVGGSDDVLQTMPLLEFFLVPTPDQAMLSLLMSFLIFAIMLVPYCISALIATRLYAKRQF